MLELEVVVVVVGLRSEANLLDRDLRLVGLQLLCLFLLLVEELLVIGDAAHGGSALGEISIRSSSISSASLSASRIGSTTGCSTLSPTTRTWGAVISSLIRCGLSAFSVENRVLEASVSVNCYSRESMVAAGMDEVVLL